MSEAREAECQPADGRHCTLLHREYRDGLPFIEEGTPKRNHAADKRGVENPVWIFARGSDRLEISREVVDDGVMLIVTGEGTPRSYFFREALRLDVFQRDMETLLLKTGWSFQSFAPERRAGRDRRGWPRKADDRRRWWTDGSTTERLAKVEGPAASSLSRDLADEESAATPKGTRSK